MCPTCDVAQVTSVPVQSGWVFRMLFLELFLSAHLWLREWKWGNQHLAPHGAEAAICGCICLWFALHVCDANVHELRAAGKKFWPWSHVASQIIGGLEVVQSEKPSFASAPPRFDSTNSVAMWSYYNDSWVLRWVGVFQWMLIAEKASVSPRLLVEVLVLCGWNVHTSNTDQALQLAECSPSRSSSKGSAVRRMLPF